MTTHIIKGYGVLPDLMVFSKRSINSNANDCSAQDFSPLFARPADLQIWRSCLELVMLLAFLSVMSVSVLCWSGNHQAVQLNLLDTINPNIASPASLVRLPGIGPAKAYAIIEYRKNFAGGAAAFACPHDLANISGIGPKTVEKMQPWLTFEEETGEK